MMHLNKQDVFIYLRKVTNGHSAYDCSVCLHLLVKFIDDALCPLEVQVSDLGGSIDICQLDTHLAHQESVVLVGPVNSRTVDVVYLKQTGILLSEAQRPASYG